MIKYKVTLTRDGRDELPKQPIGETRIAIPMQPVKAKSVGYEYVRRGMYNIFMVRKH